jgi:flagellar basal body-associated protein FliL
MANEIMKNEQGNNTEETVKTGSKKKLWTILGIGAGAVATAIVASVIRKKRKASEEQSDEDSDDCAEAYEYDEEADVD